MSFSLSLLPYIRGFSKIMNLGGFGDYDACVVIFLNLIYRVLQILDLTFWA